jgi:hypothetical protein
LSDGCLCIALDFYDNERKIDKWDYFTYSRYQTWNPNFEILWHEPQLHDVFRVAKKKWIGLIIDSKRHNIECYYTSDDEYFMDIPYDPNISIIAQEDSTKQSLIQLFS